MVIDEVDMREKQGVGVTGFTASENVIGSETKSLTLHWGR